MASKKLDVFQTITDAVNLGISNFVPLLLTAVLYVVTIWIPWLNVGTTIGFYKTIIKLSKGETIEPTAIFSKDNFNNLGNFFLLLGLVFVGTASACVFMFVPGIVMGIAWGFSTLILIDKQVRPVKAMALSDKATYGNKWRIFLIMLVFGLAVGILSALLGLIPYVGPVLTILVSIVMVAVEIALWAVMYRTISEEVDAVLAAPAE